MLAAEGLIGHLYAGLWSSWSILCEFIVVLGGLFTNAVVSVVHGIGQKCFHGFVDFLTRNLRRSIGTVLLVPLVCTMLEIVNMRRLRASSATMVVSTAQLLREVRVQFCSAVVGNIGGRIFADTRRDVGGNGAEFHSSLDIFLAPFLDVRSLVNTFALSGLDEGAAEMINTGLSMTTSVNRAIVCGELTTLLTIRSINDF